MSHWTEEATRRSRKVLRTTRAITVEFRDRNASFMAGSIAYAGFVSLLPLSVLSLLLVSFIGSEALASFVTSILEGYINPSGEAVLTEAITDATGRTQLSVLTFLVLLWGVLKVFRNLDTAFSEVYGVQRSESIVSQIRDGLVVLVAIGVATAAMFVVGAAYALTPALPFAGIANIAGLVLALSLAFFPIYYVFPNVDLTVREVVPGVVVAAVGWAILQAVFQIYVAVSSTADVYGVLGAVVLFITWLYFASVVLLVGAVTNEVLRRPRDGPSTPKGSTERRFS